MLYLHALPQGNIDSSAFFGEADSLRNVCGNSPVKLWFSIKLIATEFFSTPFNC